MAWIAKGSKLGVVWLDKRAREGQEQGFLITYTSSNHPWPEWIAFQFKEAGYSTTIQAWDFRRGTNFVPEMDTANKTAARTIDVLSPAYFASDYSSSEWTVTFRRDYKAAQSLLLPLRIHLRDVMKLLDSIV